MERAELGRLLNQWVGTVVPDGPRRVGDNAPYRLISESDPGKFMAAFADAVAGTGEVFLHDPKWSEAERAQARAVLAGGESLTAAPFGQNETGWLMMPTGGTSGTVRFARHDSGTLGAAVAGFTKHFGFRRVNAVGVLPFHHVSGLMAWLRCVITGGAYLHADWKEIEAQRRPQPPPTPEGWVLSLVPTQLERLLRDAAAVEWLKNFQLILLGGGPAWPELLERAATARLPVAPGYGMTETVAMVAALKPEEFLAGIRDNGTALPHALLMTEPDGTIAVAGKSLFRGYYPGWRDGGAFTTEDVGALDLNRRLTVLGRRDGVIITGGEKVHPAEVEAVLRGTGEFADVAVLGLAHPEWGAQVVAAHPAGADPDMHKVHAALARQLARFKHPQRFVALNAWPRNDQGKLNRVEIARMAGETAG